LIIYLRVWKIFTIPISQIFSKLELFDAGDNIDFSGQYISGLLICSAVRSNGQ